MLNEKAKREVMKNFLNMIEDFDDTALTIFDKDDESMLSIGCLWNIVVECLDSCFIIQSDDMGTCRYYYDEIKTVMFVEGDTPHMLYFFQNQDGYKIF